MPKPFDPVQIRAELRERCEIVGSCWIWAGRAYGARPSQIYFRSAGATFTPQGLAYRLHHGNAAHRGGAFPIKQTCGNSLCCRPEHQYQDTSQSRKPQRSPRSMGAGRPSSLGVDGAAQRFITPLLIEEFTRLVDCDGASLASACERLGVDRTAMEFGVRALNGDQYWDYVNRRSLGNFDGAPKQKLEQLLERQRMRKSQFDYRLATLKRRACESAGDPTLPLTNRAKTMLEQFVFNHGASVIEAAALMGLHPEYLAAAEHYVRQSALNKPADDN